MLEKLKARTKLLMRLNMSTNNVQDLQNLYEISMYLLEIE